MKRKTEWDTKNKEKTKYVHKTPCFSRLREQIHVFFPFAVCTVILWKLNKVVNEVDTYNTRKTFSDSEDEDDSKKQKRRKEDVENDENEKERKEEKE